MTFAAFQKPEYQNRQQSPQANHKTHCELCEQGLIDKGTHVMGIGMSDNIDGANGIGMIFFRPHHSKGMLFGFMFGQHQEFRFVGRDILLPHIRRYGFER